MNSKIFLSIGFSVVSLLNLECNFLAGECRLFKKKQVELGRSLTENESKLFESLWIQAQKYRYFEDTLGLKDSKGCNKNKSHPSVEKSKTEFYEKAFSRRREETKALFQQYIAYKSIYERKRKKDSVLKKWALVRFELKLCLPINNFMATMDSELGIDSKIFQKVGFIENLDTRELIPYIKPFRKK